MKTLTKILALTGLTAALCSTSTHVLAQDEGGQRQRDRGDRGDRPGRGNFDPEQMRARMMERYREQLEVKDDAEWKLIEGRIEKVGEARREAGPGMGGLGPMMFGRGPGGPGGPGGPPPGGPGGDDGGRRRAFRGMMGEPLPEAEALQKAIEAKASNEEIKDKLAKLRDAKKDKEAKLQKSQDELRKVLSVRQEAVAVLNGLLQ